MSIPFVEIPLAEEQPTVGLEVYRRAMKVGRTAVYEAARRGEIEGLIKVGGQYRVATAALRRQLQLDGPIEVAS